MSCQFTCFLTRLFKIFCEKLEWRSYIGRELHKYFCLSAYIYSQSTAQLLTWHNLQNACFFPSSHANCFVDFVNSKDKRCSVVEQSLNWRKKGKTVSNFYTDTIIAASELLKYFIWKQAHMYDCWKRPNWTSPWIRNSASLCLYPIPPPSLHLPKS